MKKIECDKCKNSWIPRTEKPIKCPRCFQPLKGKKNVHQK